MNTPLISETGYARTMEDTVLPYLDARRRSGFFERAAGMPVYYESYDAEEPRAVIVIAHGYSSALPKFYELVWYFLQEHYSVRLIQQRGHGLSCRMVPAPEGVPEAIRNGRIDPNVIWIPDYRELVYDLEYFARHIAAPSRHENLPLYLFAHSMGGGIGACVLGHCPELFRKAVLTAPMLAMNLGNIPAFAAWALAAFMIRAGKGGSYMPGAAPFSETPDFEGSAATSRARYDWYFQLQKEHPEYRMCVTPYQTGMQLLRITQAAMNRENLSRITSDVLLLQAENDTYVRSDAQERFVREIPNGKLVRVDGSKHEIYRSANEVLGPYLDEIMNFLDR